MSSDDDAPATDVLYIGRSDPYYDGVWSEMGSQGYTIAFARTQNLGLKMARALEPRIIIINSASSQFTGENLCRDLGRRLPNAQRLVILDRGKGENLACEHQLIRPFTARKFQQALLRLLEASASNVLQRGNLRLDLASRTVVSPKGLRHLTPKECHLLAGLMRRPNQVISRKDLMEQVWNTGYLGDTRTLDVHIRWLREKIEPDPKHPVLLVTKRGVGYLLRVPGEEDEFGDLSDEDA